MNSDAEARPDIWPLVNVDNSLRRVLLASMRVNELRLGMMMMRGKG